MIKVISFTGFISILLIIFSLGNVLGQESQNNLPLSESESKEEVASEKEYGSIELNYQDQRKTAKKPGGTYLKNDKAPNTESKDSDPKEENRKNSILKSSSSLVTVFYVLVSYLFSGPLDSPGTSNRTL